MTKPFPPLPDPFVDNRLGQGITVPGCECYGGKGWHYPPCPIVALYEAAKDALNRDDTESWNALSEAVEGVTK